MTSQTVAALYVDPRGTYAGLRGVLHWDRPTESQGRLPFAERDARLYAGPYPVVAHPPCSRWCQLAPVNQARYGQAVGDDGGCFAAALAAVRRWGGVLEHPAYSLAWPAFGLARPTRGAWSQADSVREWVTEVSQSAYGHRARKRTWLLCVCDTTPPPMRWEDAPGSAWVSQASSDRYPDKPRLSKREAKATPPAFRDALIALARR